MFLTETLETKISGLQRTSVADVSRRVAHLKWDYAGQTQWTNLADRLPGYSYGCRERRKRGRGTQ